MLLVKLALIPSGLFLNESHPTHGSTITLDDIVVDKKTSDQLYAPT